MLLALAIASTVVPNSAAIPARVSPGFTVYRRSPGVPVGEAPVVAVEAAGGVALTGVAPMAPDGPVSLPEPVRSGGTTSSQMPMALPATSASTDPRYHARVGTPLAGSAHVAQMSAP